MPVRDLQDMASAGAFPRCSLDRELIWDQMERILESSPFQKSKRYPRFLRFIVEQTLSGNADHLKERIVGTEVFDRPADYDVATDPIVRIAAGEVRKRLAQYYVDDEHRGELRIELAPGSYVPRFFPAPPVSLLGSVPPPREIPASPAPVPRFEVARLGKWLAAFLGVLSLVLALAASERHNSSAVDQFLAPLFASSNPIVCLGTPPPPVGVSEIPQIRIASDSRDFLTLGDVLALNLISPILAAHGSHTSVLSAATTSFADLQGRPVVLVGGRSNQWTMRAMHFLRFHISKDSPDNVIAIGDRQNPLRPPLWTVDFKLPFDRIPHEYGIVARYYDHATDQPTFVVAGTGVIGTEAAARFLTTPEYMQSFIRQAPRGWQNRNIEIVVETEMINGACEPPHIVTTYLW